jgi:tetratricopeptide (TPR) repeat protein/tRNA A-37 threonylcarbamoyl transferase component Bud32
MVEPADERGPELRSARPRGAPVCSAGVTATPPSDAPTTAPLAADDLEARVLLGELREQMFGRRDRTRIGRFELAELLGRGAHGSVYLADDVQLKRRVAVKLLRAEGDRAARARLLREAQALARLNHPNVLTVHDVGVEDERVFIAMEHVESGTLAQWCAEHPPGTRARFIELLELAIGTARGLAAAHEAGVVHRDIKPANILVGADGRPRLADFGVARAEEGPSHGDTSTQDDLASRSSVTLTRSGDVIGTPAYMAPEQLAGRGEPASDQWSLCATFWEAAYGARPFVADSLAKLVDVVQGRPRTVPPERTEVPGWFRDVLARGLRPDPADRWPSVAVLAAELQRGAARRRRRVLALGGAALALAAMGMTGARHVAQERRHARCVAEAGAIDRVWNDDVSASLRDAFLGSKLTYAESTFERAAPRLDAFAGEWQARWADLCVATEVEGTRGAELWRASQRCLRDRESELAAVLDVLAQHVDATTVQRTVEAVARLGGTDRCGDDAWLERHAPPEEDDDPASTSELRRRLWTVRALEATGRFDDGLTLAKELRDATADHPSVRLRAQVLTATGRVARHAGDLVEARRALEAAFDLALAHGEHDLALPAASLLTFVLGHSLDRHDEGLLWGRVATGLRAQLGGEDDLETAELESNLGSVLQATERFDEAERAHLRALEIRERLLGGDHPDLAGSHNNLGILYGAQRKLGEAERELRAALAIELEALGGDHPSLASSHVNLGHALHQQGRLEEAEREYARAVALLEASVGPDHPDLATAHQSLGHAHLSQGRLEEAEREYTFALSIRERALGPDDPGVAGARDSLGHALHKQGRHAEAEHNYAMGLAIRERALGPAHSDVGRSLVNLGTLYFSQERFAEAEVAFAKALVILEKALGEGNPDVGSAWKNVGAARRHLGRWAEAETAYVRAIATFEAALGPEHPRLADPLEALAECRMELGRETEARADLERADAIRRRGTQAP